MDFKIEKILDLKKLIETHRLIADLDIEIGGFDGVNECVDASYNNTRMLKLMSEKHRG